MKYPKVGDRVRVYDSCTFNDNYNFKDKTKGKIIAIEGNKIMVRLTLSKYLHPMPIIKIFHVKQLRRLKTKVKPPEYIYLTIRDMEKLRTSSLRVPGSKAVSISSFLKEEEAIEHLNFISINDNTPIMLTKYKLVEVIPMEDK